MATIQDRDRQKIDHRQVDVENDAKPQRELPAEIAVKQTIIGLHDHDRAADVLQLNVGLRRQERTDRVADGFDGSINLFNRRDVNDGHCSAPVPEDAL